MRTTMGTVLVCALAGCGSDDRDPESIGVAIPWPFTSAQGSCPTGRLDGMKAELHVAGVYPVCDLEVAPDYSASGVCDGYYTGQELPLMVVYTMALTDPEDHTAVLAVVLGVADLRPSVLPEGSKYQAEINLDPADVVGQQFLFDGWEPAAGCVAFEGGSDAARARMWAWCYIDLHPDLFDGRNADRLLLCRDPADAQLALADSPLTIACNGGLTSCRAPVN